MFGFILQKIRSKKWMAVCLLLGNLLMIAIASAAPMYADAAMQRTLMQDLGNYYTQTNRDPGTVILPNDNRITKSKDYDKIAGSEALFDRMIQDLEIPVLQKVTHYVRSGIRANHALQTDQENGITVKLATYSDMEEHIRITKGKMCSSQISDRTIEVIVSRRTFVEQKLMLGEELELNGLKNADGEPYRIRITGIFENNEERDPYWINSPAVLRDMFFVEESLFYKLFFNENRIEDGINIDRYAILDYTQMKGGQVEGYMSTLEEYRLTFEEMGQKEVKAYFEDTFTGFLLQAQKTGTTVWVLLVPIFVLLAVFIFMVSRQMLEMEQNEISIYKSRGASKGQILGIYLLQSVCISILSLLPGIPLGMFLCRVLGSSDSFLEFVKRTAMPVEIGPKVLLTAGGAAVFSVCTMVLPVFKFAGIDIVTHKRQKSRKNKSPLWQRLFLDVVILGVAVYGLWQYNGQKEFLAQQVRQGASLDPLLYLCSSLFMIGLGLVILRLFPWIVRIVFWIGKKLWPPSLYASFLHIIRTKSNQGFLMVFLILTVAMGIYHSQAAATINTNAQEQIRYMAGADMVVQEVWGMTGGPSLESSQGDPGMASGNYIEPDFGKYLTMEGVRSATRVFVNNQAAVYADSGRIGNVMLMGIHTKEFGETAWFKEALLPSHYHEYLNAMSQNAKAILVSSNFRDIYGYRVGDVMKYYDAQQNAMEGIIYGFVDYWPTYAPVIATRGSDGIYHERDNFLVITHLSQLQSVCGVMPYQVWIKTDGSTQFLYDYAEESGTKYTLFRDASAELIAAKNAAVFQSTNGILTVGFICILIMCSVGFLIYWISSIRARTLQFGIFRAMGMSMREIITMLINEQIFVTGVSVGAGIFVGVITSRFFVPLIQIAYSSADQVIPLEVISRSEDYARLFVVIGSVMLICMLVLGVLIARTKITQALKLGED